MIRTTLAAAALAATMLTAPAQAQPEMLARFPAGTIPTHAELTRFVDDFFDLLQRTARPARAKR